MSTHLETLRNHKMASDVRVQWAGRKWDMMQDGEGRLEAGQVRADESMVGSPWTSVYGRNGS